MSEATVKFQYRMAEPDKFKNRKSHCLPMEITNSPDNEESGSQHSSRSFEQVNYGTQPDEMVQSFEDYDWEQDRMIQYRRTDKGGTDRL